MILKRTHTEMLALVCLTGLFLGVAGSRLGINVYDDSEAMRLGNSVHLSSFIRAAAWGPLYSTWFRLLSFCCPNPVERYFLSWGLIAGSLALIPALMKIPRAWIYTFLLLGFPILTVDPYVSLFTAAIVLFGLCLLLRSHLSVVEALAAACGCCFVAGFCRPEFDYGVWIAATATVLAVVVKRLPFVHSRSKSLPAGGVQKLGLVADLWIVATVIFLSAIMLFVTARYDKFRSGMAFAQHFSLRAYEQGLLRQGENPWTSDYTQRTFKVDTTHNAVTGAASMADFFHANPTLILAHVLRNLRDRRTLVLLFLVAMILAVPWLRHESRTLRPAAIFLFFVSLPPLMAVVLIYPRDHYATILVPALLLFALQLVKLRSWDAPSIPWLLIAGCSAILFSNLAIPAPLGSHRRIERTDLDRIECARDIDRHTQPGDPVVFDVAPILDIYFGHPLTTVSPGDLPQWPQFKSWAGRTHPAWIAVDPDLANQYAVMPAELDRFLQTDLGYTAHPCPSGAWMTIYTPSHPNGWRP